MEIHIEDEYAKKTLQKILRTLKNPQKVLGAAVRNLEQLVRTTFRDETDPWGTPWPPHAPATLANRARKGDASTQKLIDSGVLYNSILTKVGTDFALLEMGWNGSREYAEVQQFGNPHNRAWGGPLAPIPARPFMPMRSHEEADIPDHWSTFVFAPFDRALREADVLETPSFFKGIG